MDPYGGRRFSDTGSPVSTGNGFDNLCLMTPDEVAELFRVSKASVYRWAERGLLPVVKMGRTVRFNAETVRKALECGVSEKAGR